MMMTVKIPYAKLLEEAKNLPILELRADDAEEVEFVLKVAQLDQLGTLLQGFFGEPLKPKGQVPNKEAEDLTEPFGGIRDNQTLYHIKYNGRSCFAMIWPWGDGKLATVKICRAKNPILDGK